MTVSPSPSLSSPLSTVFGSRQTRFSHYTALLELVSQNPIDDMAFDVYHDKATKKMKLCMDEIIEYAHLFHASV